jgi:hypothetical protein
MVGAIQGSSNRQFYKPERNRRRPERLRAREAASHKRHYGTVSESKLASSSSKLPNAWRYDWKGRAMLRAKDIAVSLVEAWTSSRYRAISCSLSL